MSLKSVDPYNFELYRLKFGAFLRYSVGLCSIFSVPPGIA